MSALRHDADHAVLRAGTNVAANPVVGSRSRAGNVSTVLKIQKAIERPASTSPTVKPAKAASRV